VIQRAARWARRQQEKETSDAVDGVAKSNKTNKSWNITHKILMISHSKKKSQILTHCSESCHITRNEHHTISL
jgi:hypothetical protein